VIYRVECFTKVSCNEQRPNWQLEKLPMQRTLLGFGCDRRLEGMV